MLGKHFKLAFWGAVARGALAAKGAIARGGLAAKNAITGTLSKNAIGRGVLKAAPTVGNFTLGYMGIPRGGKAGIAGMVAGTAVPLISSMTQNNQTPTYTGNQYNPTTYTGNQYNPTTYTGNPYGVKTAGHSWKEKLLHTAPYAAWAAGNLLEDKYPRLSKALTAGAYLGYGGMAAREAYKNPEERITSTVDALALGSMLAADIARWRRH
jgi:hypothetical protein